jgi:hypothetical protein
VGHERVDVTLNVAMEMVAQRTHLFCGAFFTEDVCRGGGFADLVSYIQPLLRRHLLLECGILGECLCLSMEALGNALCPFHAMLPFCSAHAAPPISHTAFV